jgi:hypothetical protein
VFLEAPKGLSRFSRNTLNTEVSNMECHYAYVTLRYD